MNLTLNFFSHMQNRICELFFTNLDQKQHRENLKQFKLESKTHIENLVFQHITSWLLQFVIFFYFKLRYTFLTQCFYHF